MDKIGIIAAILTTSAFLPQALKTLRTKETKDLSLPTFLMLFTGAICWGLYGIHLADRPIIIANIITALLSGAIVVMKLNAMLKKSRSG